jgi:NAD(P)-dependent dehydrogenase (short-subunit alcohol dehydrogenase family)
MQDKRIALVTGANQGVGLQVAKELVENGLTVLVGSRSFERGEAAAKEIGPRAIALQLDVTDRVSIADAAERIRKEFGRLDLLVQNAAISNTRITLAMMVELESTGIKVNLVSPGFTKTNLNGYEGTQSVEDGSREVVRVALLGPDGPTGTFTRWENATIPW